MSIYYDNLIIAISGVAERWVNKEFFLSKKIKKYNSSDNGDMSSKKRIYKVNSRLKLMVALSNGL